jgi:hypothetical protein
MKRRRGRAISRAAQRREERRGGGGFFGVFLPVTFAELARALTTAPPLRAAHNGPLGRPLVMPTDQPCECRLWHGISCPVGNAALDALIDPTP